MKTATLHHYAASPRFTPREIVRLAAAEGGLDFCFGFLRQVPFQQVRLVAAYRSGRPEEVPHLLLIVGGQDRPFIVKAADIAYSEFGLEAGESETQGLKGFVAHLARHHPGITVPDDTARFVFEGDLPAVHPSAVPSLATSLRVMLDPELGEGIRRLAAPPGAESGAGKPKPTAPGSSERGPSERGPSSASQPSRPGEPAQAVSGAKAGPHREGDMADRPWQERLRIGLDAPVPPTPLLPPFGPALRYGPRRRGELLKGFRDAVPELVLSGLERVLLPLFGLGMFLVPLLYLASIGGLSYVIYHVASTDGQAVVEGSVEGNLESGSFSFVLIILVCIYLIFALLSPIFTRQARERHRLHVQRGQELVLFGFVDYLAKVLDTPVPQRIEVVHEADISVFHRQRDDGNKEFVMILGLPLICGLSLEELVGLMSRELAPFAYRPGGDAQAYIARQHRRWERILADYVVYQEGLASRLDEKVRRGDVGFLTVVFGFLAFVFFSSTRWVVTFFVKLAEWISLIPRRWARRDAERYQRQMVGDGATDLGLSRQQQLQDAHRQFVLQLDVVGKTASTEGESQGPVLLDHLPAQLVLSSLANQDVAGRRSGLGGPKAKPPIFRSSLPSTVLFHDFASLARKATTDFYRSQGVRGQPLQPVDAFLDRLRDQAVSKDALHRFFGSTINSRRPVPVAPQLKPKERSMQDLMAILAAQRRKFDAALPNYRAAVEDFDVIVDCRLGAREAFKLVEVDFEHQGMGVEEWKSMEQDAVQRMQELSATLEGFERQAGQRLMSALLLLADRQRAARLPNGERSFERIPHLLRVVATINRHFRPLLELRDRYTVLSTLREIETRSPEDQRLLLELFEREIDTLYPPILALYKGLETVTDPFHIQGCDAGLLVHGVANDYFDLAGDVLRRIYNVYSRALSDLAAIAEQVELAAGLEPLEDRGPFPEARPWRDSP